MTLYEVLQIKTTASDREIRAAYKQRVKVAHPDAGGSNQEFIAVQEAYNILSSPIARRIYDAELMFKQKNSSYFHRAPKPRREFGISITVFRHRGLFGDTVYIDAESLIDTLRRAEVYYKGSQADEVLRILTDALQNMTRP